MREIEVKARLKGKDRIVKQLELLGCVFSEPVVQHDKIFLERGEFNLDGHKGNVLRIREQGEKVLFTLKRNIANEMDCIEKEVEIDNAAEMEDLVKLLGFIEVVRVYKTRIEGKYKQYNICIDEVEDLGNFIEVEILAEENQQTEPQDKIFNFLEQLGILKSDRVDRGYDTLLYAKQKISDNL